MKTKQTFRSIWLFLALVCSPVVLPGQTPGESSEQHVGQGYKLVLGKPVAVSLADPAERRWGRHQFVGLSPYPGGRILLRFHAGEDSVAAYGIEQPTFVSADSGATWSPLSDEGLPISGLVTDVGAGQMLCMPMPKPFKLGTAEGGLPEPVGEFFTYRKMRIYPADKLPAEARNFLKRQHARRWTPEKQAWVEDQVTLDTRNRLVWIGPAGEAGLVSATSFERHPIKVGKELLWADYRALYLEPDGRVPKGFSVSCMVSTDQGKSWTLRSSIVSADAIAGEISSMTEPVLAQNAQGDILCVIRRTDQQQKSMLLTSSSDQGKTWTAPRPLKELGDLGVMPDLLRLDGGPMVLSYGRPGVYLSFSLDGRGTKWEKPVSIIAGDDARRNARTDGYTSLRAIGRNAFLMGYTDFDYPDEQGRKRKAILVRRAELTASGK